MAQWQRFPLQCRGHGFDPWVGKIPWRRAWQPIPVFLLGESHGQRSLVDYSPGGRKESDTTEVTYTHTYIHTRIHVEWIYRDTNTRVPPTTSGMTSGDVNAEESPAPFGSTAERLWMNFGNTLKSLPPLLILLMHPQSVWQACPSHPLRQGEQPSEVAVTRGLLRGQTSPPSPAFWLALQIGCMPQRAPDGGLSAVWSPWHRGTRGRRLPTPGGWVFSDGHVTPPASSWRKQTRQVEGKLHRAEVSGRFPHSTAPLPFGDPRCFRKLEKVVTSWGRHSKTLPLLPSGCQVLGEWLTLYKSYFYGFIFIKLAGLLYLPSEFSEVSF